jgi:hypothetical protein
MAAERRGGGGAGRLALILAILALVLAWAAYRRTGGELRTLWQDLAPSGGERVRITAGSEEEDLRTWLAQARARLERRRAEVAGERNLREVREEVAELRESLRRYRDTGTKAKERWRELDADLERLEGQLKEGGSKALATLDSALKKIRSETEGEK